MVHRLFFYAEFLEIGKNEKNHSDGCTFRHYVYHGRPDPVTGVVIGLERSSCRAQVPFGSGEEAVQKGILPVE